MEIGKVKICQFICRVPYQNEQKASRRLVDQTRLSGHNSSSPGHSKYNIQGEYVRAIRNTFYNKEDQYLYIHTQTHTL